MKASPARIIASIPSIFLPPRAAAPAAASLREAVSRPTPCRSSSSISSFLLAKL
jgi:hypothetical protein